MVLPFFLFSAYQFVDKNLASLSSLQIREDSSLILVLCCVDWHFLILLLDAMKFSNL